MKNAYVAVLALGAGLALVQSAAAGSVGTKAGSTYVAANLKVNSNPNGSTVADGSAVAVRDDAEMKASSNEQSLLSNGLAIRREIGAPGSGHFYFADISGARAKTLVAKSGINQAASVVAPLAETREPESLFLLGTGLLCMALAVFWKSAKRTTES